MAIQPGLDLLTQVSQSGDKRLTISWRALPSIQGRGESHYQYIIEIQKFTQNEWGDWIQIATVQHTANVDVYEKVFDVELEFNSIYRVQIFAEREDGNRRERVLVSRLQEIKTQCKGEGLLHNMIVQISL